VVATARSILPSADDGVVTVRGDIGDRNTAERVMVDFVEEPEAAVRFWRDRATKLEQQVASPAAANARAIYTEAAPRLC
jgi:hypothetical protein